MRSYVERIWSRLRAVFRAEPCAVCGAPAVGFHSRVEGKLLTKGADGQPATKYYLGPPRRMCAACLRAAEAQASSTN